MHACMHNDNERANVLTFIFAVIISTVIINLVYSMMFGNRHSVLTLASIQTTASRIPEGQSEIKKLQPLVAGTHGYGHNGIYVEE